MSSDEYFGKIYRRLREKGYSNNESAREVRRQAQLYRLMHGMSQHQLAVIAGVSNKAVSTWESGSKAPRIGSIQRIADYFGILKSNIIEDNGFS